MHIAIFTLGYCMIGVVVLIAFVLWDLKTLGVSIYSWNLSVLDKISTTVLSIILWPIVVALRTMSIIRKKDASLSRSKTKH